MATFEDKYVIDTSDAEKALKKLDAAAEKFTDNASENLEDLQDQFKELHKRADKLADATQDNNRQTIKSDKDLIAIREAQKRQYKELGAAALTAAGIIGGYSVTAIEDAKEAIAAEAQLAAAIESTGGAAGQSLEQLTAHASALEDITNFSAEAVEDGQGLLLTFTNIKETFPEATQTMLDMSVAMDQDLKSSAVQLGKALNDPVKGISALTRIGVTFTEQQKDMIKAMVEAGNIAGAQRIILEELNREFGGSAEAARQAAGAEKDLEVATGELSEAWGRLLLAMGDAGVTGAMVGFINTLAMGAESWTMTIEQIKALTTTMDDLRLEFDLNLESFALMAQGMADLNPFVILKNGVLGFYDALAEGKGIFESWRAGVEEMVAGLGDLIAGAMGNFTNVGEAIATPAPVPASAPKKPVSYANAIVPAGTSHGPMVKGKAFGGLVSAGQPYLVGERGPELFVPSGNGAIAPNSAFVGNAFAPGQAVNNISNSRSQQITVPDAAGLLGNPVAVRQIRNIVLQILGEAT